MVVDQVHVYRLAISEAKDDSPIPRDAHAPLSATIPFELVQPPAGQGGELQPARYRRHRFARTPADVELLAAVDEAHETLSGPATRKILEREYQQYQQREYERLAGISVAQIYRLRRRRVQVPWRTCILQRGQHTPDALHMVGVQTAGVISFMESP